MFYILYENLIFVAYYIYKHFKHVKDAKESDKNATY